MFITSDWHVHSEYSHDSTLPIETLLENARAQGLTHISVTDHVNFNDRQFLTNLQNSAKAVNKAKKTNPQLELGVELTPIEKPEFDYVAKTGTRDGYEPPATDKPYDIELAVTKEELSALGVRYAIGASHWRVDSPNAAKLPAELDVYIREWYRQQMYMACDERVTILGHPWYHGRGIWYEDFSVIPHSMHMDIAAALKENGKYVECNSHFFISKIATERFRHQYAEFLRELFEMGIPVTYGSDAHSVYGDHRAEVEKYLRAAGFSDGDVGGIAERDLW